MSRPFIHLRRVLFGASCMVVFGFGATQALAEPQTAPAAARCTRERPYLCMCVDGFYCVPDAESCSC